IPSSLYQAVGVRDRWTGYEPGKHFAYSNIGYQIMGYLLEEITGKSSAENVRERILQPLGMTHSEPLFTHDTYTRLATGYAPLYDDLPNHSSAPLMEAPSLEYAVRNFPRPPGQHASERVANAAEYAGTYTAADGNNLIRVAENDQLLLLRDGQKAALEPYRKELFLLPFPEFALFPLRFHRDNGKVAELSYGGDWYAGEKYSGPRKFEIPAEWASYSGHYRANHAWFNNFRIVIRKDKLVLISPE